MTHQVLVLGADGFIGRHIAFELRAQGFDVLASARRVGALRAMGFEVLEADLTDPATHDPAFWTQALTGGRDVVIAAGLLTGSKRAFQAVHVAAPKAVYAAMAGQATAVLISAVGIEADTPFGAWRRDGEAIAGAAGVTILRPGLVMGDTSYGGTSLSRALALAPWRVPVVGDGEQRFNPIHAGDLAKIVADCLRNNRGVGPHLVGGPEVLSQGALALALRRWMGRPDAPIMRVPIWFARALGYLGDALKLGPISATAVEQLTHGVEAPMSRDLPEAPPPRGVTDFLNARPAGTQDLWHARLYLLRPVLRLTLALLWLVSGLIGLFLAKDAFLPLFPEHWPTWLLVLAARVGGFVDLLIAFALMRNWRPRLMGFVQLAMVVAYTVGLTVLAPVLWLLPLGGLLKNLPILALIGVWMVLEEER